MRQRLGELPIIGSEAAEERQRLSDALENLRGLKKASQS